MAEKKRKRTTGKRKKSIKRRKNQGKTVHKIMPALFLILLAVLIFIVSRTFIKEEKVTPGKQFYFPAGESIEQLAVRLEEAGYCTEEEFLEAVEKDIYHHWFLESIPEDADVKYRLQGFLCPGIYDISHDAEAEDIVDGMLTYFGTQYTKGMEQKARFMGKTTYEIVTTASLIERETYYEPERERISGVIENRLEQGMKLQLCPTALYPITGGMYDKTTVTYADTRVDSPYNTYIIEGLPAGPICNPGIGCIEAALNPEGHEYLFYHSNHEKKDGSHIFTKTYEEHLETQK